jgi:hypothetical protein
VQGYYKSKDPLKSPAFERPETVPAKKVPTAAIIVADRDKTKNSRLLFARDLICLY